MILERGDMFSVWGKTDLFLFTSNPVVNKQGLAVMGRGIAKQLADKYPQLQKDFGEYLNTWWHGHNLKYNVDPIGTYGGQEVGYFMVKDHWRDPAKLSIIKSSVEELPMFIEDYNSCNGNKHKIKRIDLNFPGIGNGKLAREDVLPIIEQLPDNVHVWEYGDDTN